MTLLYARFSTDRQSETSIADQWSACEDYARKYGLEVRGRYSDEGISGSALGNRPGAQAALDALRPGGTLLVTDLTRLSRSQDLAPLLSRLRHRGVRVVGVQDGYDSDSRTARMQAGMSGIMSEEFRAMVADRTRFALSARAREGRPTGGRAYDNAQIVREIFGRFAGGESLRAIASDLNRRGVPSPGANWRRVSRRRDGRWLVSAVRSILTNERYAGRVVWNRSQFVKDPDTGRRMRRLRPQSEWIVTDCEPVVDEVTWNAAQARFRHREHGGVRRYLLSGLLTCEECGGKLIVAGGSQRRYVCGSRHAGGPYACSNALSVPRETAERLILAPVVDDLLSGPAIEEGVRALRRERAAAERHNPASIEVDELERLVREGVLSPDTAAPAIAAARAKAAATSSLPWPSERVWRETVANLRDVLLGEDIDAARDALRGILGAIPCAPAEDGKHLVARLTARQVMLATGNGIWIGSGGRI